MTYGGYIVLFKGQSAKNQKLSRVHQMFGICLVLRRTQRELQL